MRLPRKQKKLANKKLKILGAIRTAQVAMLIANSRMQIATIAATPQEYPYQHVGPIAEIVIDTAVATKRIMNQTPFHWKHFMRPSK